MRSKAHTALTAPLVLHYTRIYKCAKKVRFQLPNAEYTFFDCHLSFLTGKRRYNAARVCKLRNGVKNMHYFLLFSQAKGGTKTIGHLSIAEGSSF